jgi:hypothetical protein
MAVRKEQRVTRYVRKIRNKESAYTLARAENGFLRKWFPIENDSKENVGQQRTSPNEDLDHELVCATTVRHSEFGEVCAAKKGASCTENMLGNR